MNAVIPRPSWRIGAAVARKLGPVRCSGSIGVALGDAQSGHLASIMGCNELSVHKVSMADSAWPVWRLACCSWLHWLVDECLRSLALLAVTVASCTELHFGSHRSHLQLQPLRRWAHLTRLRTHHALRCEATLRSACSIKSWCWLEISCVPTTGGHVS